MFTWEEVGDRPLNLESFSFAPGGGLYAAFDSVYAFEPGAGGPPAGRWRALGWPRGAQDAILALGVSGDTLFTGTGGGIIRRSTDGGQTWAAVNGCDSGFCIGGPDEPDGFHVVPAGRPHAGRILAGGTILYSDDRGSTWHEATRSFPGDQGFAHTFTTFPSGQVLMGGNWGMARSEDSGTSYVISPVWGDFRFQGNSVAAVATPGSVQSGAPSCGLTDVTLCDGAIALGIDAMGPSVRAWWTNDGGRSWSAPTQLPEPFDGVGNGGVAGVVGLPPGPAGLGRAVAVLGRGVVYATADGGQTWRVIGRLPLVIEPGTLNLPVLARLGPDGHLWVSTLRGSSAGLAPGWIYRSAEPAVAAFVVAGETPPAEAPRVGVSVRPNPAGGRVEVVVSLASSGPVRVVVLDALGREVTVILDGETASGERAVGVDASSWPAGVYVVHAALGSGPMRTTASSPFTVVR